MSETRVVKVTVNGQARRVRASNAYQTYAAMPCPSCEQKRLALWKRDSLTRPYALFCHECGHMLVGDAA